MDSSCMWFFRMTLTTISAVAKLDLGSCKIQSQQYNIVSKNNVSTLGNLKNINNAIKTFALIINCMFHLLQSNFILGEIADRLSDLVAKWWMSVDNLVRRIQ